MPLTQLDTIAALIVIDLQKGIVGLPTVHPTSEIVTRSAQLARAFRERDRPVVLVNVSGGAPGRTDIVRPRPSLPPDWTELVSRLLSSRLRRFGELTQQDTHFLQCTTSDTIMSQ